MKQLLASVTILVAAALALSQTKPAAKPVPLLPRFCADPTQPDTLCSFMPVDVGAGIAGYSDFTVQGQTPFDNFSYQSLVALNWPANPDGTPSHQPFNSPMSVTRVWDFYKIVDQVFPASGVPDPAYPSAPPVPPECNQNVAAQAFPRSFRSVRMMTKADDPSITGGNLEAAVNLPLLDRNLNYTIYEVLVNRDEFEYVVSNKLYSVAGQTAVNIIDFPLGKTTATAKSGGYASTGAIEVKAAWRILDLAKGDIPTRYFTRQARIYVPAKHSDGGAAFCTQPVTLGLVGIHILHKTADNLLWVWSTFEHADNAPTTSTADGQPGCAVPTTDPRRRYSYFNPSCFDPDINKPCVANRPPNPLQGADYTWASKAPLNGPYAQKFATGGKYGTQVVRCQPIYDVAKETTRRWSAKLAGTPWQYYQLVGTQWQTAGDPPRPPINTIPKYVLNTTLETYLQKRAGESVPQSACIQCHNFAYDATGRTPPDCYKIDLHNHVQPGCADFSFLPSRAKNWTPGR
jgi:hypothetical protein